MNTRHRIAVLAWAVLVTGCATTPVNTIAPVSVEDKSSGSSVPSISSSTPANSDNNYSTATQTDRAKNIDTAALKDPNSPLAQRSFYYDLDSFIIKDEYKSILKAHAKFLQKNPEAKLIIQGNTDERGSREYNLSLGQKRAEGVRQALKLLGVSDNQIEAVSFGEEKPKNTESTEAAWAENRRSDLVYEHE